MVLATLGVAIGNSHQIEEENPRNGNREAEKPDKYDHSATDHLAKAIVEGVVDAVESVDE